MKRFRSFILVIGMMVFVSFTNAQHLTSAKLYLNLKQYDRAEASGLKAVDKDPGDEEAWFVLGKISYELQKYIQMLGAFDKASAIDSTEYKTEIQAYRLKVWADSYNAGIKYYNRGRDTAAFFQNAIEQFKTAILAIPDSTRTYYILALTYYGNKQSDEAIKTLNRSLEKDPKKPEELKLLGQLHLQSAREKTDAKDEAGAKPEFAASVSAFEKLIPIYRSNHDALIAQIKQSESLGKSDTTMREKLNEIDRSSRDNIMSLIELYERLGMSEKSLTLTRDAVASDPTNPSFRYVYGVYFIKQEKYAEGIEQLSKVEQAGADSTNPIYPDAVYNLGVAYLNWGVALKKESEIKSEAAAKAKKKDYKEDVLYKEKFNSARVYFEKTAEQRPNDPVIWQQLAKLYAVLNMSDKAKKAYEKYDQLNK